MILRFEDPNFVLNKSITLIHSVGDFTVLEGEVISLRRRGDFLVMGDSGVGVVISNDANVRDVLLNSSPVIISSLKESDAMDFPLYIAEDADRKFKVSHLKEDVTLPDEIPIRDIIIHNTSLLESTNIEDED